MLIHAPVMQLLLRLIARQGEARTIADSLQAVARRARHNHACAASDAYASVLNQNHLALAQDWRAESDLSRYIRSDDFTQILALIDMAAEAPRLDIQRVVERRGLEYVAEVRRAPGANRHTQGEKP